MSKKDRARRRRVRERPPVCPKRRASFMKLPKEIRQMIYTELLVDKKQPLILEEKYKDCKVSGMRYIPYYVWLSGGFCNLVRNLPDGYLLARPATAICRVSKRLNEEANEVLYGYNSFNLPHEVALCNFLEQIGQHNVQRLRDLDVWKTLECRNVDGAVQKLATAKKLRRLGTGHINLEKANVTPEALVHKISWLLDALKIHRDRAGQETESLLDLLDFYDGLTGEAHMSRLLAFRKRVKEEAGKLLGIPVAEKSGQAAMEHSR